MNNSAVRLRRMNEDVEGMQEAFLQAYLAEVERLDRFMDEYRRDQPAAPLDPDDPDVRRLLEAQAFFAVRSRAIAQKNLVGAWARLFNEYFDSLLSPVPCIGLLKLTPTEQLAETTRVPEHTEVLLRFEDGRQARFQTLQPCLVGPYRVQKTEMLLRPARGFRLLLELEAQVPMSEPPGVLSFHIHHLSNYAASLLVHSRLRTHLQGVSVLFDEVATERSLGMPCPFAFGRIQDPEEGEQLTGHPALQRVRAFFHFPEQGLFFSVKVQAAPRVWTKLTLLLDLDERWPYAHPLNREVFQLGVVPLVNRVQAFAQYLALDGTRHRHPLLHPDREAGFRLQSFLGVYQVTERGLVPLPPAPLQHGASRYELEENLEEPDGGHALLVHDPSTFFTPTRWAVEARWHQPWVSQRSAERLEVVPYERSPRGLSWHLLGSLRPAQSNPIRTSLPSMLQLLSLRMKSLLTLPDLQGLLETLGTLPQSPYRELPRMVRSLTARLEPTVSTRSGSSGTRVRYQLEFVPYPPSRKPLVDAFIAQLQVLLDAWGSDAVSEVLVEALSPTLLSEGGLG